DPETSNINPGSNPPLSSRFGLFTSPESLFTCPDSVFTSSRNLYSHRPGIGIHMPRNTQVALDLACGLGRHALWLANRHWQVSGVDLSDVAIGKLSQAALA